MTNDILTSVDLMTMATDLDDANEAYRAALIRSAAAQREVTAASVAVEEAERARSKAMHALCGAAVVNPVTQEFWANPLP